MRQKSTEWLSEQQEKCEDMTDASPWVSRGGEMHW